MKRKMKTFMNKNPKYAYQEAMLKTTYIKNQ